MVEIDLTKYHKVQDLLYAAEYEMASARALGERVLVLRCGSTPKGGTRKKKLKSHLFEERREERIGAVLCGEKFTPDFPLARYFFSRSPELENLTDLFGNPDVILVYLI